MPPPCPMASSPPHTLSPPLSVQTSTIASPPTSNKSTSPLHVQVSNKLIIFIHLSNLSIYFHIIANFRNVKL